MDKLVRERLDEQFEKGKDPFDKYKVGKKELLKRKYGVDDIDKVLMDAAYNGNLEDVKMTVKKGANTHVMNYAPLFRAARNGYLEIVEYLFRQGVDSQDAINSALGGAAEKGHLDIVKYLIENGTDIHGMNNRPLILAASNDHLDIVKYLHEKGLDIHQNLLPSVVAGGCLDVLKYIVNNTNVDVKRDLNELINIARRNSHYDVVEYLRS